MLEQRRFKGVKRANSGEATIYRSNPKYMNRTFHAPIVLSLLALAGLGSAAWLIFRRLLSQRQTESFIHLLCPGSPRNFGDQMLGNKIANLAADAELGACWVERCFFHPCLVAGSKRRPNTFLLSLRGRL